MRRLGSLVMRVADATRVPAGACLAVDRVHFADGVTRAVEALPGVRLVRRDNGKELASVAQWGPYAGQLHRVHQVTFDNRGNLYTAEIERALGWT